MARKQVAKPPRKAMGDEASGGGAQNRDGPP